jgi:hypothetical protein
MKLARSTTSSPRKRLNSSSLDVGKSRFELAPRIAVFCLRNRRPESSRSSSMQAHNCRFDYQLLPSINAHLHPRARRSSGFIGAIKAFGDYTLQTLLTHRANKLRRQAECGRWTCSIRGRFVSCQTAAPSGQRLVLSGLPDPGCVPIPE